MIRQQEENFLLMATLSRVNTASVMKLDIHQRRILAVCFENFKRQTNKLLRMFLSSTQDEILAWSQNVK